MYQLAYQKNFFTWHQQNIILPIGLCVRQVALMMLLHAKINN